MCTAHHRDIEPESLKRYSSVIASLVAFVARCQQGRASGYRMQLTEDQTKSCQALWDELHGHSDHRQISTGANLSVDEDWQDCFENYVDLSEDSDDEIFGDADSNEEEPRLSIQDPSSVSWGFAADTPLQARILELLITLYVHLPLGAEDKLYSPVLRFLVLSSRKKSGQWALPHRITQFIAILLFCGRLTMMALMHRAVLADSQLRYSRYAALSWCNFFLNLCQTGLMMVSLHSWTMLRKD